MKKQASEIEILVINRIVNMLVETKELVNPQIEYLDAPDFVIKSENHSIGVELVSYLVDATQKGAGIRSQKRIEWEKLRKKMGKTPSKIDGAWLTISLEVIELILNKAQKLSAYRKRSNSNEYWLIIHSENLGSYEELGSTSMAPLQNLNFTAVIQHHLDKIPFNRVYLYDIKNKNLFGGDVNLLKKGN